MSSTATLQRGTQVLHLERAFPLHLGGTLRSPQLAYEVVGPETAPLVVVLGGISAGRRVASRADAAEAGWWAAQVGPRRAIDTERVRVLGIDWLGGIGASTGPEEGEPFPTITSHDQALALERLLDALGVDRAARIVGASFGGMVALAFAQRFPARVAALTVISAAHESHPLASAWRSLQRRIVALGCAAGSAAARESLAIARGLAMTTYRAPEELAERFAGAPVLEASGARFPIDSWLEARGEAFAARWTPESFRVLSYAIDLHRVRPEGIRVPATLIAARSDRLVPLEQVRELARRFGAPTRLVELRSRFGHDAFLKEESALGALLRRDLAEVSR